MVEFNIQAGLMLEMFKLTQLVGKNYKGENKPFMDDCVLEIREKSAVICAADVNDAIMSVVTLPLKKENVHDLGKIPIELQNAMDYLKRYNKDDVISIKFGDGKIKFRRAKPELEYEIPTIGIESISTALDIKEIPFKYDSNADMWVAGDNKLNTIIKMNASEFKEVIADGEQIQYRNFPITISKDKIICVVEDEESGKRAKRELQAFEIKTNGNISSIFSHGFGNLFTNLSGEIKIWIGNELPMAILYNTDTITANYLLATSQLTEMEEQEEEQTFDESDDVEDNINKEIDTAMELVENVDDIVIVDDETVDKEPIEKSKSINITTNKESVKKNASNKK